MRRGPSSPTTTPVRIFLRVWIYKSRLKARGKRHFCAVLTIEVTSLCTGFYRQDQKLPFGARLLAAAAAARARASGIIGRERPRRSDARGAARDGEGARREGKGILAADESDGTIKKRLDSIGVESTAGHRQAYRDLLFTTDGRRGVHQRRHPVRRDDPHERRSTGRRSRSCSSRRGSSPGSRSIRARSRSRSSKGETVTEGLDGLRERLAEYRELGARFAKWRATYSIGDGRPSEYCVWTNAHALGRYAALCQEAGIVPIVEPEVLMDGDHTIEESARATGRAQQALYTELHDQRVDLRGTLLKPNMVLSGYDSSGAGGRRGGRRGDARGALPARAGRGARDRVPLGRPVGRGRDRAPERDERARAAPVAALVLVRPCAPGAVAEGVARRPRERRGGEAAPSTTARR